jgi:hypothetical protein
MQVIVVMLIGFVWWVAAWALGVKSFDAFLITLALTLAATAVHVFKPYVQRMLGHAED